MVYISYKNSWKSEFDNIVSIKNKVPDLKINQLKLEVHDTFETDEKITTEIKPTDDLEVINKSCLKVKLSKVNGHLSLLEKDYNELKFSYNKQWVEELLFQRAVKTTIRTNFI